MTTTAWRWFPVGLIGAMGFVFLVNGYMVYDALSTFPGSAGKDGFDLSNEYKQVLAAARRQAELGWTIDATVTNTHRPALHLNGKDGAPIKEANIQAQAERPVGPPQATTLPFTSTGNGDYQATTDLPTGQWDILLTIQSNGESFAATRRVVVK